MENDEIIQLEKDLREAVNNGEITDEQAEEIYYKETNA